MIDQFLNETYGHLGIFHVSETVKLVTLIFLAMIFFTVVFFIYTLTSLIVNKLRERYRISGLRFYRQWLMKYLIESGEIPVPPLEDRTIFRDAILELLLITKDYEFKRLMILYMERGYWDSDLAQLKSPYWYDKIDGIVRLDQWKRSLGKEVLAPLIDGENKRVSQFAMINLSRTHSPEEAKYLLNKIVRHNIHESSLYEIIYRLFVSHRQVVVDCLSNPQFEKLWPLIVDVIGMARSIEEVPVLIRTYETKHVSTVREKSLAALGKIGDPRGLPTLIHALKSVSAKERLSALHSLFLIDSREIITAKDDLMNDPDPSVRNWISHYVRVGL